MGAGCCCCPSKDKESEDEPLGSPLSKRSCTDPICFALFFLYWAGLIGILIYTLAFGNVLRLFNGFDSYGNTCGINNTGMTLESSEYPNLDHTGRPYQFFSNFFNALDSLKLCVSKCPDRELSNIEDVKSFYDTTGSVLVDYKYKPDTWETNKGLSCEYSDLILRLITESTYDIVLPNSQKKCLGPFPAFEVSSQTNILNRCIPEALIDSPFDYLRNSSHLLTLFTNFLEKYKFFNELGASFYLVRWDLVILLGTALAIALLLVFLIRFVIKIVVWFVVVLAALAACGVTGLLWWNFWKINQDGNEMKTHSIPILPIEVDAWKAFLTYSIIATVFTVILILVIIVMRKRLQLAVALFQEAGKVLEHAPLILIQPVYTYLFHIVMIAVGIIMLILIAGVTTPSTHFNVALQDDERRNFTVFEDRASVTYFWWYIVVGVIWIMEFGVAMQQLIIAGTVAEYYFTRDKKTLKCTIGRSCSRTVLYHIGSAAFGAFIITLVRIPRYIMMKIAARMEKSGNECAKFLVKCCVCCLWCLEKCLRYINRNAYIVIAISGTNFCVARVRAFTTLTSNILRVAAINSVGDFVLFLGKVIVMAANTVIAYFLFDRHNSTKAFGEMNLFFLPMLATAIYSYFIAHCFLSSYEMLVDTLLLCFCEDVKVNDGSEDRPYFMSKSLMNLMSPEEKREALSRRSTKSTRTKSSARLTVTPAGSLPKISFAPPPYVGSQPSWSSQLGERSYDHFSVTARTKNLVTSSASLNSKSQGSRSNQWLSPRVSTVKFKTPSTSDTYTGSMRYSVPRGYRSGDVTPTPSCLSTSFKSPASVKGSRSVRFTEYSGVAPSDYSGTQSRRNSSRRSVRNKSKKKRKRKSRAMSS